MIENNLSQVETIQSTGNEDAKATLTNNQPSQTPQSIEAGKAKPWDVLKATVSFRKLMEADGHRFRLQGKYPMCRCPFHNDRTPSFSVMPEDTHGRCFGCDWYGNIFDYEMKAHKVDFRAALQRLEKKAPKLALLHSPDSYTHRAIVPKLTKTHRAEQQKYLDRLRSDSWLHQRICDHRNPSGTWNAETIKLLADQGSLGWAGDALAFIYTTGTKYRQWPGREYYWDKASRGNSIWREAQIAEATDIHLTEGETDAITLIGTGIEKPPGTAVCAVPGASAFSSEWTKMFEGKRVTIWFDADEAGERGKERVGKLLTGVASSIACIDLKEVL